MLPKTSDGFLEALEESLFKEDMEIEWMKSEQLRFNKAGNMERVVAIIRRIPSGKKIKIAHRKKDYIQIHGYLHKKKLWHIHKRNYLICNEEKIS